MRNPAPPPANCLYCYCSRHRSTTHSRNCCYYCNRGSATTTQPSSEYTEMHPQKRAYSFLSDFNTPVRSVFSLSIRSPSACAILSRRLSASDFSTAFPDEVSKHPAGVQDHNLIAQRQLNVESHKRSTGFEQMPLAQFPPNGIRWEYTICLFGVVNHFGSEPCNVRRQQTRISCR